MYYGYDGCREWADILADEKCGGRPGDYEDNHELGTVQIGTRLSHYEYGSFVGFITVTAENKQRILWAAYDPENDIDSYYSMHDEWLNRARVYYKNRTRLRSFLRHAVRTGYITEAEQNRIYREVIRERSR